MRLMAVLACILVAYSMGRTAAGLGPTGLVSPEYLWVFWFGVAGWLFAATKIAVRGAK